MLFHTYRDILGDYHRNFFKDQVYLDDDWRFQRTWRRHLPNLSGVRVLVGFLPVVLWTTSVALFVCVYHIWLEDAGAPRFYQEGQQYWQAFATTSFALALLMVFRTNSSYSRWWEARTLWGHVLNVTRNLVREAIALFSKAEEPQLLMLARWTTALPYLLNAHLSSLHIDEALQNVLPAAELAWLLQAKHRPNRAAQVLSALVLGCSASPIQKTEMDTHIKDFVNITGACERIQKTPIPLAYTRHTSRFLMIWLTFLPFAVWPVYGWATPGITAVITFLLVGVENIGIQIEQPFAVIAMDYICAACKHSVEEMMASRYEVAEMTSAGLRLHEGLHDHNHPQQDSKQVLDRQIEVSPEK